MHSSPDIHELVISSPQYVYLLKKYEDLKQDIENKKCSTIPYMDEKSVNLNN